MLSQKLSPNSCTNIISLFLIVNRGLSKWSSDFSIRNHKQTHVQVSIRSIDLPQEYWRHTTLFEIDNGVGTSLTLDNAAKNHTFSHFTRILVDLDLSKRIFNEIMVE